MCIRDRVSTQSTGKMLVSTRLARTSLQRPSLFRPRFSVRRAGNTSESSESGNYGAISEVPSFDAYRREPTTDGEANRLFTYFVIGSSVATFSPLVKSTVANFLDSMNPSADVMAVSSAEVDLSAIAEGSSIVVKWRGKPLFITHRTAEQINAANSTDLGELRDPEVDNVRTKKPEWLVLLGICTHLGCVPLVGKGDYGGYFCPCHGSHYDTSGRIRKGPAPKNLEVPPYKFLDENRILVG
eukprot:TRINITY_DN1550_c0_g1_i2.p1 TRINITY_DN1550_c0_g1~~TRINITY_DN1550_c0_g1_i2.p1  ORF type:complete len:241 (-),score=60.39 TRINITY_DN1550_c0_g1_i2:49-771(-)